jgi:hypothetical protein
MLYFIWLAIANRQNYICPAGSFSYSIASGGMYLLRTDNADPPLFKPGSFLNLVYILMFPFWGKVSAG